MISPKLAALGDALNRLQEVLAMDPQEDSVVIDATIHRFEFTYELLWKTVLLHKSTTEPAESRKIIL